MEEAWEQATRAINKKATITPPAQYRPGDQVWLEVTHLKLPHQGSKLNPKWYGPLKILEEISPIAFKLKLPVSWIIHPVFHMSLLTPYIKMHAHSPNYSWPPPYLINDIIIMWAHICIILHNLIIYIKGDNFDERWRECLMKTGLDD